MIKEDIEMKLNKAHIELRKAKIRLSQADTRQAVAKASQDIDIWNRRIN